MAFCSASVSASDNAQFNYQGRMLVDGAPFNGTGQIKLAIVNTSGTVTLWSNDGSSEAGSEPVASISAQTVNGVFDVMVGDPAAGMKPIPAVLFNGRDDLRLRVWFNDGPHGFEQLTPDRPIVQARMLGLREATEDLTLYVDADKGDDANSGLTTATAKRTIQSAVDMVPKSIRRCKITIKVAPGIYREAVKIYGIKVAPDAGGLLIQGDPTTSLIDSGIQPTVRITGTDEDENPTPVRDFGFHIYGCDGVSVEGFMVDYFTLSGCRLTNSNSYFRHCKSAHNLMMGFLAFHSVGVGLYDCWAANNTGDGFRLDSAVGTWIGPCKTTNNALNGFLLTRGSTCFFGSGFDSSSNAGSGLELVGNSYASFNLPMTATANSNSGYGLKIGANSTITGAKVLSISGNLTGSTSVSIDSSSNFN